MPGDTTGSIRLSKELYRSGHSTVLTIPPEVLDALGWDRGDTVFLETDSDGLTVRREAADA